MRNFLVVQIGAEARGEILLESEVGHGLDVGSEVLVLRPHRRGVVSAGQTLLRQVGVVGRRRRPGTCEDGLELPGLSLDPLDILWYYITITITCYGVPFLWVTHTDQFDLRDMMYDNIGGDNHFCLFSELIYQNLECFIVIIVKNIWSICE